MQGNGGTGGSFTIFQNRILHFLQIGCMINTIVKTDGRPFIMGRGCTAGFVVRSWFTGKGGNRPSGKGLRAGEGDSLNKKEASSRARPRAALDPRDCSIREVEM